MERAKVHEILDVSHHLDISYHEDDLIYTVHSLQTLFIRRNYLALPMRYALWDKQFEDTLSVLVTTCRQTSYSDLIRNKIVENCDINSATKLFYRVEHWYPWVPKQTGRACGLQQAIKFSETFYTERFLVEESRQITAYNLAKVSK